MTRAIHEGIATERDVIRRDVIIITDAACPRTEHEHLIPNKSIIAFLM